MISIIIFLVTKIIHTYLLLCVVSESSIQVVNRISDSKMGGSQWICNNYNKKLTQSRCSTRQLDIEISRTGAILFLGKKIKIGEVTFTDKIGTIHSRKQAENTSHEQMLSSIADKLHCYLWSSQVILKC